MVLFYFVRTWVWNACLFCARWGKITCKIKTGHSNLVSCFGPRMRALAKVLYRGEAEVEYCASARIRGPKHDTRFEWPVSILIMTRYPFLLFKTHKTSAKNPRLLTIAGAIWFCRYRLCTTPPPQLWMHAPVAKERRLMIINILFSIARTIWILSECKLSTDNYIMWIIRMPIMHID